MNTPIYFITNNRETYFGGSLRECGWKIQQEAKKIDPNMAGFPIDIVLKVCANKGYKAGMFDISI